jgi:hypothetical protein
MGNIIQYEHHNEQVWVDEDLKGKHRDMCLCYKCDKFNPENREANCEIANALYRICVYFSLATPVFECPDFKEKGQ